jgi:voltage-gated potassium channel
VFDWFIIVLISVNVLLVILDTFHGIPNDVKQIFSYIEVFSVAVFTIEYLLRLWIADYLFPNETPTRTRVKYIISFMALVDLLAILPFYLPFIFPIDLRVLRMVRLLRLLRMFKFNRYTSALATVGSVLKRKATQLLSSMFVVAILMVMASILMYNIEYEAQPDVFENAFSGLWWAIATLTTVGYGDIYPITILGKVLGAVIALLGIGLVAVPTGIISAGFMEDITHEKEAAKEEKHFCPYCGKNLDE